MNTKLKLASMIAISVTTLSCGLNTPTTQPVNVETIVASTLQAYTQNAPNTPASEATAGVINGTSLSAEGLSFIAPTGIANSIALTVEPAAPPADDMPWWGIYPEYKVYALQGYPLTGTFHEPKIYIYPIEEYVAMNESVANIVQSLKDILNSPSPAYPERLPFLPTWNAGQEFHSNTQVVAFQNGTGVRYLTQYGQFPSAVTNTSVFYTYQGISSDGKYYVAAVLPISAPFLPSDSNPDSPLPADGVPFDWNDPMNNPNYFPLISEKLTNADPTIFSPTLTDLDALIQSISIQ